MSMFTHENYISYLHSLTRGAKVYVRNGQEVDHARVDRKSSGSIHVGRDRFSSETGKSSRGLQLMYPTDHVLKQCEATDRKRRLASRVVRHTSRPSFKDSLMRLKNEDLACLVDIFQC